MARSKNNATQAAPQVDVAAEAMAQAETKREPSKARAAWETAKPHVVAHAVEGAKYTGIAVGVGVLYALALKAAVVTYNAMS
jgi:hypothetical protein